MSVIMLQGECRVLTNLAKNQFCNGEVFPRLGTYVPPSAPTTSQPFAMAFVA